MADGIEVDFSELDRLAADLGSVPDNAGKNIRKAVEITSLRVKRAWQQPLKGSEQLPRLPYALGYDISLARVFGTTGLHSVIGFDKNQPQGALGNISEFGTPTTTGRGFGLKALADNEDDFAKGLEIAVEQAEREAGL